MKRISPSFPTQLSDQPRHHSPVLREQSIAAFIDELDRPRRSTCSASSFIGHLHAGTEEDALRLIADALRRTFRAQPRRSTMVLLEHTSRPGPHAGPPFEHLGATSDHLDGSPRVGVCLDPATWRHRDDIVTDEGYRETFSRSIGCRLGPAQGVPRQRLEEAVRKPVESARAHLARDASASSHSGASSTIAGSPRCQLLIETEKRQGRRQTPARSFRTRST